MHILCLFLNHVVVVESSTYQVYDLSTYRIWLAFPNLINYYFTAVTIVVENHHRVKTSGIVLAWQ